MRHISSAPFGRRARVSVSCRGAREKGQRRREVRGERWCRALICSSRARARADHTRARIIGAHRCEARCIGKYESGLDSLALAAEVALRARCERLVEDLLVQHARQVRCVDCERLWSLVAKVERDSADSANFPPVVVPTAFSSGLRHRCLFGGRHEVNCLQAQTWHERAIWARSREVFRWAEGCRRR